MVGASYRFWTFQYSNATKKKNKEYTDVNKVPLNFVNSETENGGPNTVLLTIIT